LAFILFTIPSDAVRAFKELDGTDLQGRLMHIIPGEDKRVGKDEELEGKTLKQQREIERRKIAGRGGDWGTLFMNVQTPSNGLNIIARCSIVIIGNEIWRC
jgi:multiple RNA-binding domain-containing protein 1